MDRYERRGGGGFRGHERGEWRAPPPPYGRAGFRRERERGGVGGPPPLGAAALPPRKPRVDRDKVCPFLVRVFVADEHHSIADFVDDKTPEGEIHIYTWEDETMRDIVELVKQARSDVADKGRHCSFSLSRVFWDTHGIVDMKEIARVHSTGAGPDDSKCLGELGFDAGEFLDVAVQDR